VKSPFNKGRSIVPLFGKEGQGEIFEKGLLTCPLYGYLLNCGFNI